MDPDTGKFNHFGRLSRQPLRGPHSAKEKNSLPQMWMREVLESALQRQTSPDQNVFIDLCAGWQSWRPIVESLGLVYIAVDINGDRNVATDDSL